MATVEGAVVPIGEMRERVTIQQAAVTVDAAGDPSYAWSDVATVWARVRPVGGTVETNAERRSAVRDYDVTIRWRDGISPANRLIWRGRYLQIGAVAGLDERRSRVTLTCRDVGPDAGITP